MAGAAEQRYIFVTIGTTKWDALVEAAATDAVASAAALRGFPVVLLQLGRSALPSAALRARKPPGDGPWEWTAETPHGVVRYRAYRLKPDISKDMAGAALVVSPAGAGSVFEALRAHRPLIVASNPELAGNHQEELAGAVGGRRHAVVVPQPLTPEGLARAVASIDVASLEPLPPADPTALVSLLRRVLGGGPAVETRKGR